MLTTGTLLQDRYRIDRLMEFGVMGAMYRAWDTLRQVTVSVKELTPQPDLDEASLERLRRKLEQEAGVLRTLRHPSMVTLVDFFHAPAINEGKPAYNTYLVMDFVEGESLAERIARLGALPEAQVKRWAAQILDVLDYCHNQGVLHRDIKPHNIIIRPDGDAVLVGFEPAKLWDPNDPRSWAATRVMGTPEYASPERWGLQSWRIDALSDLYSLGATLYHALTGKTPQTAGERMANPYRFLPVRELSRVSARTRAVIVQAMELPREKRFRNAAAMKTALLAETPLNVNEEVQPARLMLTFHEKRPPHRAMLILLSVLILSIAGLIGMLGQMWRGAKVQTVPPAASSPLPTEGQAPTAVPSPIPSILPTKTPLPTPRATSGPATLSDVPPGWTLAFSDDFHDNAHTWVVGSYRDDWGTVTRVITDGLYTWDLTALHSVGRWCMPEITPTTDFYLTVDARRVSGPPDAGYGLVLRHSDGNYYLFSIRDDGFFNFNLWYQFNWRAVVDWTGTFAIQPGQVNRLAVLAKGDTFTLSINGEQVAEVNDTQLPKGEAGLSVLLITPGNAVFTFERFRLYTP